MLSKVFLLTIMFLSFLPIQVSALMIGLSTEYLAKSSDTVIMGEVKEVKSYWDFDSKKIITRARVVVKEFAKGGNFKEAHIEYEGGEVGGIEMRVSDISPLVKGEKVILFLKVKKTEKGTKVFEIVGDAQGKYTVEENGIAMKTGFSVVEGTEGIIDNRIPAKELLEKVRRIVR